MRPTYIQGIYKNSKNANDFSTALMALGCHLSSIDSIYALCKQGDFNTAAQMASVNGTF